MAGGPANGGLVSGVTRSTCETRGTEKNAEAKEARSTANRSRMVAPGSPKRARHQVAEKLLQERPRRKLNFKRVSRKALSGEDFQIPLGRCRINDRNSVRVSCSSRKQPSIDEVTAAECCFSTPRFIMQRWRASMTTPTPCGWTTF